MASQQEREYLDFETYRREEAERAKDTVSFLSGPRQPEQERSACAAFLRAIGVPFLVAELTSLAKGKDPPDVLFRDGRNGRVEVCESPDPGRRRHDEARARAQWYQQAQTMEDVSPSRRPGEQSPLSLAEAYELVAQALATKLDKKTYAAVADRATLDALVCIQRRGKFLRPALPLPSAEAFLQQGWRSVLFIMDPYSHVIYAGDSAPAFLQEYRGQIRNAWPGQLMCQLFSLDPALDTPAMKMPPEEAI
jgi:hypothetical protein